jgi:predicted RNA-binding Zn ribbon-like protein
MVRREDAMTQAARGDREDGFVFRGGVLALELVNTEIAVRGKPVDLLATTEDLGRWWTVCRERYPAKAGEAMEEATPALLEAVQELRGALRRTCDAVTQHVPGATPALAPINRALGIAHPVLSGDLQQTYALAPGGSAMLFHIARSALLLLTERDLSRLHKCRHQRCVLYFYDTTKSGTRQWCSLDCHNRSRSSENYRRRKATAR